jgi:hypothetical protein
MKNIRFRALLQTVVALAICRSHELGAQTNGPPTVSIVWPKSGTGLSLDMRLKIKADATSPNGSITQVQFLALQTNTIGVVTNPPFSFVWHIGRGITNQHYDLVVLTAVAMDAAGLSATSAPVIVPLVLGPPAPILQMTSPGSGAVFPTSNTIVMSAELLASLCDTGPEEFFVGTNSVGIVNPNGSNETFTAATPEFSMTISNLAEGSYKVGVHYLGADGGYCSCGAVDVRVVKLAAVSPRIMQGTNFEFDVVTSFEGKRNVIEVSTNLENWVAIGTNQPATNTFTFTDPSPAADSTRFYRVLVPAQ